MSSELIKWEAQHLPNGKGMGQREVAHMHVCENGKRETFQEGVQELEIPGWACKLCRQVGFAELQKCWECWVVRDGAFLLCLEVCIFLSGP